MAARQEHFDSLVDNFDKYLKNYLKELQLEPTTENILNASVGFMIESIALIHVELARHDLAIHKLTCRDPNCSVLEPSPSKPEKQLDVAALSAEIEKILGDHHGRS